YAGGGFVQRLAEGSLFPWGTAAVNLVGCVAIGFVAGLVEYRGMFSSDARAFLLIGMLGGFTTFSTFGYETYELIRSGQMTAATANALLQVLVGIAGVWLGHSAARFL
ncbi:MAG: CrcB family protein, partial [Acidobacteriota bacterium]